MIRTKRRLRLQGINRESGRFLVLLNVELLLGAIISTL